MEAKMTTWARLVITAWVAGAALLLPGHATASSYPLANVLPGDAADKLAKEKVTTTDELLARGAEARGRAKLAKAAGLDAKRILEWVRMCDVVRIKGVGPTMAKLLAAAAVPSVAKLRGEKPASLYERLVKVNEKTKIAQKVPSEQHLAHWIEQAKKLAIVVK
jgi:predicted flap endonuclease-1-like 5' DNA nuclease